MFLSGVRNKIATLKKSGFFLVFISTILNKVVNLLYGVVLIRIISKSEYGIYSYANNVFSYFNGLIGLGMASTVLQICAEVEGRDKNKRYNFCFFVALAFNVILSIVIRIFSFSVPLSIDGSNDLLSYMSFLPVFTCISLLFMNWLRANYDNKRYSVLTIINTIAISICTILGAFFAQSIGLIVGRYVAAFLTIIVGVLFLKCYIPKDNHYDGGLSDFDKKRTMKIGVSLCLSEFILVIIPLISVTILGAIVLSDEAIASYKAATIIPTALAFLGNAVAIYAYPYFVKNMNNRSWLFKHFLLILVGLAIASTAIALPLLFFSNDILAIVFGKEYLDGAPALRVLLIGFIFNATLQIPATSLIISQVKLKFTIFISIFSSVLLTRRSKLSIL